MQLAHEPLRDPVIQDRLEYHLKNQVLSDINLNTWEIENYINGFLMWMDRSSFIEKKWTCNITGFLTV